VGLDVEKETAEVDGPSCGWERVGPVDGRGYVDSSASGEDGASTGSVRASSGVSKRSNAEGAERASLPRSRRREASGPAPGVWA
jgi:hypothetical protein